ncbi:helix-turn-helix domain-containing protein [Roseovarius aestuariivivens]|uniref:helix-turn-helix domain-containing protein n=1 Tax=Roseovarius aestuariivivens TaxID=1888910 RepID=UPI001081D90A|nr:helix-turn-helix transcriptional regulator [Roseovarius aestuariivivens]
MQTIDQAIGARIRTFRKALGLSQKDLAERIGVTFQQVQKYESGTNRIAASRLWRIADTLGVSVVRLFEELDARPHVDTNDLEMLDLFHRLPTPARKQALFQMRALVARHSQPRAHLEVQNEK